MNQPLNDWRGKPIQVGSTIVYATTASSSVTMNEAIVAVIEYKPETRYNHTRDANNRRVSTSYTVQVPSLQVRKTVEHSYGTQKVNQTKLQKLTRIDRVTVVEERDGRKCNFQGCTADKYHDDPTAPNYYPAHSFERD